MEYLPTGNRNLVFGVVLPPPGHSVSDLRATGFSNQAVMMKHTGRELDGIPAIHRSFFVGDPTRLFIGAVAEDPNRVRELRDFMRELHSRIPGVINFAAQAALFSPGIGEGRAIDIELSGTDLNDLVGTGRRLFGELRSLVPGSQLRPDPVLDEGAAELHVIPRREEIKKLGMTSTDLGLVADAYIDGAIIGEFSSEGQPKRDVVIKSPSGPEGLKDVGILSAPVATPAGTIVPFSSLATIERRLGPTTIKRLERRRGVVLQLTPPDEVPFEAALDKVEQRVAELERKSFFPRGVKVSLGGSAGKLVAAQSEFAGVLLVAFAILALILTGLYQDFLLPWVVLVTVPLAAAGGILGLVAAGSLGTKLPLDLMTAVGFLILLGVVVNNAILVVDVALQRLREGASITEATAAALRSRMRPIFMTTLTSIAGLMPMVLGTGSGSELYRGIGTIVLGGLALSTVLSLVVVPSLFALTWHLRAQLLSLRRRIFAPQ
jgi:HAE1 family hydrophobic/amphiphilic exporter-1